MLSPSSLDWFLLQQEEYRRLPASSPFCSYLVSVLLIQLVSHLVPADLPGFWPFTLPSSCGNFQFFHASLSLTHLLFALILQAGTDFSFSSWFLTDCNILTSDSSVCVNYGLTCIGAVSPPHLDPFLWACLNFPGITCMCYYIKLQVCLWYGISFEQKYYSYFFKLWLWKLRYRDINSKPTAMLFMVYIYKKLY